MVLCIAEWIAASLASSSCDNQRRLQTLPNAPRETTLYNTETHWFNLSLAFTQMDSQHEFSYIGIIKSTLLCLIQHLLRVTGLVAFSSGLLILFALLCHHCVHTSPSIHPTADGHLGSFQPEATAHDAPVNIPRVSSSECMRAVLNA